MGLFLSMSGIIGKSSEEVEFQLKKFAEINSGSFNLALGSEPNEDLCVIKENNKNTVIVYPGDFMKWDEVSQFISERLDCPTFSFHIHDGDFWIYFFYSNGNQIDQFNPIPDYWDGNISAEEINDFKGNASLIAEKLNIDSQLIEKYLVRWDLEAENYKAYPDDEFENEDWQVVDFMRKMGLEYALDNDGKPEGKVFTFEVGEKIKNLISTVGKDKKPWWRFW